MGKDIPHKSHSKMKDKIKSLALKRHKSAKKITQKHKSILLDPQEMLPPKPTQELSIELIQIFSQDLKNPQILVPFHKRFAELENDLIGKIHILIGPANSGKTSLVHWALKETPEIEIVIIDCKLYHSEAQFLTKLCKTIGYSQGLDEDLVNKSIVQNETINFLALNSIITKQLVVVVKSADVLVNLKKQIILYGMFQWFKTKIVKHLGIVLISTKMEFTDKMQKRVKSRMTAKRYAIYRPDEHFIREMYSKRVAYLIQKQKQNKFQLHSLIKPYLNSQESDEESSNSQVERSFKTKSQLMIKQAKRNYNELLIREIYLERLLKAISNNKHLDNQIHNSALDNLYSISYYLNIFKLVIASEYAETICNSDVEDEKVIHKKIAASFKKSAELIYSPVTVMKNILTNSLNTPEIILLIYIQMEFDKMRLRKPTELTPPIMMKNIYSQHRTKVLNWINIHGSSGNSYFFTPSNFQRALENLVTHKIVYVSPGDIWSKEIIFKVSPEDITRAIKLLRDLPQFLKSLIAEI